MVILFKNITYFSILFFLLVIIDIYVKLNFEAFPYRYMTKPFIMIFLGLFYYINNANLKIKELSYILVAIGFFLIGDIFFINQSKPILFTTGLFLFVSGKIMYCMKFSNFRVFTISSLLPFLLAIFIYMMVIFSLIYENLEGYVLIILAYLFVSQILYLFAFLRKDDIDKLSFRLVLFGVLTFIFSETIKVLATFYTEIIFQEIIITFSYASAQFLIIVGITKEVKNKDINIA